jgi:hypothetical protein
VVISPYLKCERNDSVASRVKPERLRRVVIIDDETAFAAFLNNMVRGLGYDELKMGRLLEFCTPWQLVHWRRMQQDPCLNRSVTLRRLTNNDFSRFGVRCLWKHFGRVGYRYSTHTHKTCRVGASRIGTESRGR